MPFDAERFNSTKATLRTAKRSIEALRDFFGGDKPEFELRQLTGEELARCHEAAKINRDTSEIVAGLLSDETPDRVQAVLAAVGRSRGSLPDEHAKRIEMLLLGCQEPRLDRMTVVRIAELFPVDFLLLTNVISGLSGQGALLGESTDSGQTRSSGSRRRSAGNLESPSLN